MIYSINMDFNSAVEYIMDFTDYEKLPGSAYAAANFDLRRVEELLARLGNPQDCAPAIHIAGTKGKGSTAAMIASVLTFSGKRTGLFTSPHLHTIRERIRVDGKLIKEDEFADIVSRLKPEVESVNKEASFGWLTTFEILTAAAFLYFKEKAVGFQVLEVGLGGRLDATNVVKPEVCIITTIGLDHTEVLGKTLNKIAAEKAGIIKPGCTTISSPQHPEAMKVIEETCGGLKAPLIKVGHDVKWHKIKADLEGQHLSVDSRSGHYELYIPLLGDHQLENAAIAVAAIEALIEKEHTIPYQALKEGLAQVKWPARFQVLAKNPFVIADGAHNVDSAIRLRQTVQNYFPQRRLVLVLGTSGDKDIKAIVSELAPISKKVILTRSRHPRAADTGMLSQICHQYGLENESAENINHALQKAKQHAGEQGVILVTGSLFLAAEAIEAEEGRL